MSVNCDARVGILCVLIACLSMSKAQCVEKYSVLNGADAVVVGLATGFQSRVALKDWRLVWIVKAKIAVDEVLLGDPRIRRKEIEYLHVFSCRSIFDPPFDVPTPLLNKGIWFLRFHSGSWRSNGDDCGDVGYRELKFKDDYRNAILGRFPSLERRRAN